MLSKNTLSNVYPPLVICMFNLILQSKAIIMQRRAYRSGADYSSNTALIFMKSSSSPYTSPVSSVSIILFLRSVPHHSSLAAVVISQTRKAKTLEATAKIPTVV